MCLSGPLPVDDRLERVLSIHGQSPGLTDLLTVKMSMALVEHSEKPNKDVFDPVDLLFGGGSGRQG